MVCFSCGRSGHGVSRCSRVDTAFPFLPPGWLVDFRQGQYRVMWPTVQQGNADWSGWEGQPPGSVLFLVLLTLAGTGSPPLSNRTNWHGCRHWCILDCPVGLRVSSSIHLWVGPRPLNLRNCSRGLVGALPNRRRLRLQSRTFRLFRGGGGGFVPSPTENFEFQEDIGKMRPAGKIIK